MRQLSHHPDSTYRTHWFLPFTVQLPSVCFPRLLYLIRATIQSRSYRSEGIRRPQDHFGLFHYALAGNGIFRQGKREYPIAAGQGFLCRLDDPKTAYYAVREGPFHWECLGVTFMGTAAMMLMEDLIERYGPVFDVPRQSPLIARFLSIGQHRSVLSAEDSSHLVFTLLQSLGSLGRAENDTTPELVCRAVSLIEERSSEAFSVSDISKALSVSREHLTRLMRHSLGTTPHEIIRRKRVEAACGWLRETRLTVKEISAQLGYGSPAAFINLFRKYMKVTPADFRRTGYLGKR